MHILHGTWLPGDEREFDNSGQFLFWIETENLQRPRKSSGLHPFHLMQTPLINFFRETLPLPRDALFALPETAKTVWFLFPSTEEKPLPSPELAHLQGAELPESFHWRAWRVFVLAVRDPLSLLKEIHFQASHFADRVRLGADLLFWHRFGGAFRDVLSKHHYIPAIFPYQSGLAKGRKKRSSTMNFSAGWLPLSTTYQDLVARYAGAMPGICRAALCEESPPRNQATPQLHEPRPLLQHFSTQILNGFLARTRFTQKSLKAVEGSFIAQALGDSRAVSSARIPINSELWQQWARWRHHLEELQKEEGFILCFRLHEAPVNAPDHWILEWLAASRKDPSLQVALSDYWNLEKAEKTAFIRRLGRDFEQQLLIQLGHAARMYPKLWAGLKTDQPQGVSLDRDEALAFLREYAWVLEDSGYRVIVPAWWTPQGRRRALLRLRAGSPKAQDRDAATGYFTLPSLAQYRYELAIGGEPVSEQEWRALVEAKSELVHFRGQWLQLDREQMEKMLEFWQQHGQGDQQMPLTELLQRAASAEEEDFELICDEALEAMMARLRDVGRMTLPEAPSAFQGKLREYQRRGLAWLRYLEQLGLGPCLADDMGLGKTIQVIAMLLMERAVSTEFRAGPTLLVAPTSVLGNWQRELQRFAPSLNALIHHGPQRPKEPTAFEQSIGQQDVIITSYALMRLDSKLFQSQSWERVVVDEAQNLKNPKSAQTRAILKLTSRHRLALTGTPIENRLLDLWSIFQFLNPGYLGTMTQFKQRFERPIQKEEDRARTMTLKRLVEPFILRRLKSDKRIIKDLPDKVEQKVYCNLTSEQASLYQAVVDEVQAALEGVEGIQRKGLILSTLMRLKQICNHPAQFLQDGSEFAETRSHKLERITQMVEEVIAESESLLVFTQFTEVGEALAQHFRRDYHFPTFYLHGGTARGKRERMIAAFQEPESEPSVFVLSLKAGGIGITLTRANHVFHFDRWWNPAVENQATDRAYRIGQEKNVFVHKMVTLGTLEERIDQMLEEKQRLAEGIVGSDEAWLTELNDEAFRELIKLNRSIAVLD
jgi:SNF2 family DNA or RNA helicase